MKFEELEEFRKDVRLLTKKFPTLKDDLNVVKRVLEVCPGERPPFSSRLTDVGSDARIIKLKKIASKASKDDGANSGLRLIYAWLEVEQLILFIELYHKDEKAAENRQRIQRRFRN